jgi:hypothetical protein
MLVLPDTADNQVITTFQDGTTCEALVPLIGQVKPKPILKLLDLATNHIDGEEAITFSKRKPEEKLGEAPTTWSEKEEEEEEEEERKLRIGNLVAAADK